MFILHCRKVTILVVGLDKAGKTSSIRGMLKGNTATTLKLVSYLLCSKTENNNWSTCFLLPVLCSSSWCGSRTHPGLHPKWAAGGELPGDVVGCGRIGTVERILEGALWGGPWDHLCGGLQWQAEDKGGQGGSCWPAEATESVGKTLISVIISASYTHYITL